MGVLIIKFKDTEDVTGDQVRFKNWFRTDNGSGRDGGRYDRKVETIEFADGTKWSASELQSKKIINGSDEADTLSGNIVNGYDGDDVISGTGSKDYLSAGAGNDVIQGKSGDDKISGGSGDDTYIFNESDGHDTITDSAGDDTLVLGTESRNVVLSRMAGDLEILMKDSGDSVTVKDWFNGVGNQIESIKTSDHAVLIHNMTSRLAQAMAGFEDEKGISWTQAVKDNNQDVNDILAAHWKLEEEGSNQ